MLMLLAHVFLLLALLMIKLTEVPFVKSVLALHFGWLLTYAAINLMLILSAYEITRTSRGAWAVMLLIIISVASAVLSVVLREPMMALGTAFGVFAYAAWIGNDTHDDPILYSIYWYVQRVLVIIIIPGVPLPQV